MMEFTIPGQQKGMLSPTKSGPLPRVPKEDGASKVTSPPLSASQGSGDPFIVEPESKKKAEFARRQDEFRRLMNLPDDALIEGMCSLRLLCVGHLAVSSTLPLPRRLHCRIGSS